MGSLDGRIALVTGGARGLGAEIAKAFVAEGASVLITDILEDEGAETARALGNKASFFKHDVTNEEDWVAAIKTVKDQFGGLDILVNNAGIAMGGRMEETSLEDFRRVTSINLDGVFLGMKHAGPLIRERMNKWEGGGSIINISSVAGLVGLPGAPAYTASKGAVRLMTKSAALEYAGNGERIRVNSIHPGFTETAMVDFTLDKMVESEAAQNLDEAKALLTLAHPMGRLGQPTDIANAAVFLASDESAFMTGSEVVVDGGLSAR
jgi:NAD(P)-dependent dehydrogenase (short-subunit alcohol dehydrogenase family)